MNLPGRLRFAFENYGGTYQLRLRTAEDLAALEELDEPFWMATSAPVDQFTCDPVLLQRLDRNGTGRIQSTEVREAARWLLDSLRDRRGVDARTDALDLAALDAAHDEGRRLHDTAKRVLQNLGQSESAHLTLDQVRDRQAILAQGAQNGDGVIPPESVADADLKAFVEDIMAALGSVPDLSGASGVDRGLLDKFIDNAKALLAWYEQADGEGVMTFGAETGACYALFKRLEPVLDAYFRQCQVVAFNETLGRALEQTPCADVTCQSETQASEYLAQAPLARPRTDRVLSLNEGLNPFYADALAELADTAIAPLLADRFTGAELNPEQWAAAKQGFAAYETWLGSKRGEEVEALGFEKLHAYLDSDVAERLGALIEADCAAGEELEAVHDLEYLILLQRWFLDVCNNFVSFPYLYHPDRRAMFETGRLVMGGRVFNLNLRVADVNAHSALAARSGIYLLYSEVTGVTQAQPYFVVTPVTDGPIADLAVGKRGVLFDLSGQEWDTRVIKVVENPVNLGEAMVAPFKRLAALIASTAERITAGTEQQLQTQITQATTSLEAGIKEGIAAPAATAAPAEPVQPAPAAPQARSGGGLRDLMLAGSVMVAALGTSFAFIAKTFSEMGLWDVLAAVGVGLAIILVPTTLIAYVKLRRRNLSAVLEGSGWTINAPMPLTPGLRRLIVQKPPHPKSFQRLRKDLTRALARAARLDNPLRK